MSGLVIAYALAAQARRERLDKQLAHARKCKATD